jgi:hypothetical protein
MNLEASPQKETASERSDAEWMENPAATKHETPNGATPWERIVFSDLRGLLVQYCQVIGIRLRQAGRDVLVGRCPIHREKSGLAFAVYPDGHWWCFGKCNRGGDVVDLDRELSGGEPLDAARRIRAMNLGEPVPLSEYDPGNATPIVITPENPLGLPYFLSAREREICANCAHRLAHSNYWLSQVASLKGWKQETVRGMALDGDLGVDPVGRICFNYESGLKFRYNNLDTGERIVRWRFGKPTLWRLFGVFLAWKFYLTEGESDAISLIDEGVETEPGVCVLAVPCAGFNLAPLASLFIDKEIVLVPDPDDAGLKAATKWVAALEPYAAHLSYLNFISKEVSHHGQE